MWFYILHFMSRRVRERGSSFSFKVAIWDDNLKQYIDLPTKKFHKQLNQKNEKHLKFFKTFKTIELMCKDAFVIFLIFFEFLWIFCETFQGGWLSYFKYMEAWIRDATFIKTNNQPHKKLWIFFWKLQFFKKYHKV